MNLGELELGVYDQLGFNSTPDSVVIRRLRGFLNDAHKMVLGKRGFELLRRGTLPVLSVANSPLMAMPQAATAILIVTDRTNNRTLDPCSIHDIRYRDPGMNFSGSIPDQYAILNYASCVAAQPSAANSLFIVSDAAADGSGLSVNIEGVTTGGYPRRASIALNGLTAVNVDANCSTWLQVTKFYISGKAAGNVSLHEGSGVGNELGRIVKGRSYPRYTIVHLSGTPSSALTYYVDVELHVDDMINVTDEPLLFEDFHWLMKTGALMREYLRREKMPEYGVEKSNWKEGMADLAAKIRMRGGVSKSGQRGNSGRDHSQLGSMFGAGT